MEQNTFNVMPLAYGYDALEPYIDSLTMQIHHDKHYATYVSNLNKALSKYPEYQTWSLEKLIKDSNWLPKEIQTPVKNNAGGVYNHQLYFMGMSPNGNHEPVGELKDSIDRDFNDFDGFKKLFKEAALGVFGSGYAWLVLDYDKTLRIVTTSNQDTPLNADMCPLILIDVWEHAYYLKHHNLRTDYIDDWFNVVDFKTAEKLYEDCLAEHTES